MDFLEYLVHRAWTWVATNGLTIAALLILIVLVPRIRRFVIAVATANMSEGAEETKGRRALVGAVVYIVEVIAYFAIGLALLNKFGISLTAAAIPATVISAAVGFGAQGVIGDLLGGVFIIAEKQYGIGDWVEFHAPSGTVQGSVVNMTLRATTIRTLNGEEIVIPNSEARMCINYSSQWSRAVIEIPVPMTAGGSVRDLEERTLAAAQRAIQAEGVREHVLSDMRIQSSTGLVPPTSMGLPWTVTMRLIADCEPGDQWLIERAVRGEIIDTWWENYGERAEYYPLRATDALTPPPGADDAGPASPAGGPDHDHGHDGGEDHDTESIEVRQARENGGRGDADARRRSDLPAAGAELDAARHDPRGRRRAKKDDSADTAVDTAVSPISDGNGEPEEEKDAGQAAPAPAWSDLSRRERVRRVLSAGGRARPSTVVLIVLLLIIGALNIATVDPAEGEDGVAGWLAPSRFTGDDDETEAPEPGKGGDGANKETPANDQRRDTGTDGTRDNGRRTGSTDDDGGANSGNTGNTGNSGNSGNSGNTGNTGGTGDSGDAGTGGAANSGAGDESGRDSGRTDTTRTETTTPTTTQR